MAIMEKELKHLGDHFILWDYMDTLGQVSKNNQTDRTRLTMHAFILGVIAGKQIERKKHKVKPMQINKIEEGINDEKNNNL